MLGKLSRRKFLQISSFSATAAFLAACAPGAAPSGSSEAGAEGGTGVAAAKTEIIHWGRNPTEEEVVWKSIAELAEDMFPEITITLQSPPEQMAQKLLVAFAGGTAPDTAVGGLSSFGGWIGIDMISPIQSFVDADADVPGWLPEYVPAALEGYSQQGQLYGVPTVNEGIMLWYHKDAILEAGLTPPSEIEDDPEAWNWNTVVEYALAINQGEGFRRDRFGVIATSNKGINGWSESWGNLVYANGGRFLDDTREEVIFDSPETIEALQWVVDLTHLHDVQPNSGEMGSASILDRAMFQNGQLGMVVQGEFFRRYLWGSGKPSEPIPFAYDMALMPFSPSTNERSNIYHGNGTFMTTQTEVPEEAWKLLKTVFTQEAQQIITDNWGSRGAHRGTYESFLASNAGGGPDGLNYEVFNKVDAGTAAYPTTPYLTKEAMLEPMWRIVYDNIFSNTMPVSEGVAQIQSETVALLDRGREDYNARQ